MGKVKFGTNQIDNPTPSAVNLWVRVFTVAAGIFLAWMSTANVMGENTKDIVGQILGLALLLANGLAPLFGIELSGRIPAKDVTAVDTTNV